MLYTKISIKIKLINWMIVFFDIFLTYNILKYCKTKKKRYNEINDIFNINDYIQN